MLFIRQCYIDLKYLNKYLMIVYTPLNLPKMEPDEWDVFWNIWHTYSGDAIKRRVNRSESAAKVGSTNVWQGLDIYKRSGMETAWDCPYFDISAELPMMYQLIKNLGIRSLYRVRLIQSKIDIGLHTDDNRDEWKIRGFLRYTSDKSQWYFSKPHGTERTYITLPESTNWFSYNDKHAWHGTDYDPEHKKILVQLFFLEPVSNDLISSSIEMYKPYTIEF